ncbi:hypothetical protein C3V39_12540 [Prevotella sp. oral taxon 820]|nr:hypothetical protein C3V39_12540 [Prevotella sp. oral taxon 820]
MAANSYALSGLAGCGKTVKLRKLLINSEIVKMKNTDVFVDKKLLAENNGSILRLLSNYFVRSKGLFREHPY